jgi:hypothetical protein
MDAAHTQLKTGFVERLHETRLEGVLTPVAECGAEVWPDESSDTARTWLLANKSREDEDGTVDGGATDPPTCRVSNIALHAPVRPKAVLIVSGTSARMASGLLLRRDDGPHDPHFGIGATAGGERRDATRVCGPTRRDAVVF